MIRVKVIVPKPFRKTAVTAELEKGMNRTGVYLQTELKKPIRTWLGERPGFEPELKQIDAGLASVVAGTGSEKGINKWIWLNKGTRVRYAHMTSNFLSKTTPGFIGSRTGRGGLLFINKKMPLPGIEARNWEKEIKKRAQPKFKLIMEQAMKNAARVSGNGISQ